MDGKAGAGGEIAAMLAVVFVLAAEGSVQQFASAAVAAAVSFLLLLLSLTELYPSEYCSILMNKLISFVCRKMLSLF